MISIWDEIQRGRGCRLDLDGKTLESQIIDDPDKSKFYNEADTLEDAVLFLEEFLGKNAVALYKGTRTELNSFLNSGPDWVRFVNDLDTDKESKDDQSSEGHDRLLLEGETHLEESDEQGEIDEADDIEALSSEECRSVIDSLPGECNDEASPDLAGATTSGPSDPIQMEVANILW